MLVARDPFARQELHRRVEDDGARGGCHWCGTKRKGGRLFKYFVETDGGRRSDIPGLFCAVDCMRSHSGT